MRISRAMVMITIALLITAVGCTKQVAGTAESDPNKPPLSVSKDGYGIVAGFDNAPAEDRDLHRAAMQSLRGSAGRLR